ncbi:MAG: hypothetical protein K6C07_01730 [Bacteroidales bacterium]|nr:hypothetical protein [Bacteroidales bacterium]
MTVAEQKVYDNYLYNKFYREDVLNTSRTKGVVEGYLMCLNWYILTIHVGEVE